MFCTSAPQPNPVPSGAGRSRSGVVGLATLDAYRLRGFIAREDCKLGKFFMRTETCTAHAWIDSYLPVGNHLKSTYEDMSMAGNQFAVE